MQTYWELFLAFFRANIVGYGGGPGSIPLIRKEVVDIFGWMTNDEFTQVLAVANALPGPIATKLATHVGYQVGGFWGAITGIVASVAPTALMMLVMFSILSKYRDAKAVKGLMLAVQPVIIVMLLHVAYEMGASVFNETSVFLVLITLASLIAMFYFNLHPALLIVAAMGIGVVFSKYIV